MSKPLTERPIGEFAPDWARNVERCKADGLCPECGRVALDHCSTIAGQREVAISGMCEECWDALFADDESKY